MNMPNRPRFTRRLCVAARAGWGILHRLLFPKLLQRYWWVGALWGLTWFLYPIPWELAAVLAAKTVLPLVAMRFLDSR